MKLFWSGETTAAGFPRPPCSRWSSPCLLGLFDEGLQSLLPNRVFDLIDVAFNSIAATMIIGMRWVVARVRTWAERRRSGA